MITVLTTRSHTYTHRVLERDTQLDLRVLTYEAAFRRRRLRSSTYVFSDLDRLTYWELERAGHLYRQLKAAGLRTLNDPAKASQRFKLLRQLRACGINEFDAWSLNDIGVPTRYPVFLRTVSAHRGVLTGLLADEAAFNQAVTAILQRGIPARELIAVEYCAEPLAPGLFRKLSVFRVGDRMVGATCVHDSQWVAKSGVKGIAGQALYDDEFRIVRDNPYAEILRQAFEIADIDYGRADFGLVRGRPQVYEINTNPSIEGPHQPHPFEARVRSAELAYRNLVGAFAEIDGKHPSRWVEVQSHPMTKGRRWNFDRIWRP